MFLRFLSAQWLGMGFIGVVSLGVSVAVARVLGPEQFGVYAIALSAGAVVVVLIDGGFSTLLQRERVRATTSLADLEPLLPGMANAHALLVTVTLIICSILLPSKYGLTFLTVVLLSGAMVRNQFALAILRGDGRLLRDAFWQVGARTFTAVGVALAFLIGADLPWHVFLAQFIGAALFGLFISRRLVARMSFGASLNVYRAVSPFVWLNFATVIYFRADLILFEVLRCPKIEVGQYGVAYRLIEAVILFSSPIGIMLFRRFRQARITTAMVLREIAPTVFIAMIIGLALASNLWFFGRGLIIVGYGDAYRSAGDLLMILGCSLVFILPNGVLTQAALACGLEKWFAISASIAAVVNILGNFLLIPLYGVVAAAWMTVLTEAVLGACVALGMLGRRKPTLFDSNSQ